MAGGQPLAMRPGNFAPPQSQPVIDRAQMENDPVYQQILQQKREEMRRLMEEELAREQATAHAHQ